MAFCSHNTHIQEDRIAGLLLLSGCEVITLQLTSCTYSLLGEQRLLHEMTQAHIVPTELRIQTLDLSVFSQKVVPSGHNEVH